MTIIPFPPEPGRGGDVQLFLEGRQIYPYTIAHDREHLITQAIWSVLMRLPDEEFYTVERFVSFVIDVDWAFAFCVEAPADPQTLEEAELNKVWVISIQSNWRKLSLASLIGLVAHELAHCFIQEKSNAEDEAAADSLVRDWGFAEELHALRHDPGRAEVEQCCADMNDELDDVKRFWPELPDELRFAIHSCVRAEMSNCQPPSEAASEGQQLSEPEELAKLREEVTRLKRENDILIRRSYCELTAQQNAVADV